jgi:hypothetical protein
MEDRVITTKKIISFRNESFKVLLFIGLLFGFLIPFLYNRYGTTLVKENKNQEDFNKTPVDDKINTTNENLSKMYEEKAIPEKDNKITKSEPQPKYSFEKTDEYNIGMHTRLNKAQYYVKSRNDVFDDEGEKKIEKEYLAMLLSKCNENNKELEPWQALDKLHPFERNIRRKIKNVTILFLFI